MGDTVIEARGLARRDGPARSTAGQNVPREEKAVCS